MKKDLRFSSVRWLRSMPNLTAILAGTLSRSHSVCNFPFLTEEASGGVCFMWLTFRYLEPQRLGMFSKLNSIAWKWKGWINLVRSSAKWSPSVLFADTDKFQKYRSKDSVLEPVIVSRYFSTFNGIIIIDCGQCFKQERTRDGLHIGAIRSLGPENDYFWITLEQIFVEGKSRSDPISSVYLKASVSDVWASFYGEMYIGKSVVLVSNRFFLKWNSCGKNPVRYLCPFGSFWLKRHGVKKSIQHFQQTLFWY